MNLRFWQQRCISCRRRKPSEAFTYMIGGSIVLSSPVCRKCFDRRLGDGR